MASLAGWVRSLTFALLFYGLTVLISVLGSPLLPWYRGAALVLRLWGSAILAATRHVAGIAIELRGLDRLPHGPCLIAAKHQSALDTIVLCHAMPGIAMVMKRELMLIPFYGWYAARLGMPSVDRAGGGAALRRLLRDAKAAAGAGRSVLIFPQGTRTAPGLPLAQAPYQAGVAALYATLGLPVVPVALNSGCFWPRRRWRRWPGRAVFAYLPAIPPGLARAEFVVRLQDAIEPATAALEREAGRQTRRGAGNA
ncbi:MAG: 1-acyl-sn-glycerol-3-phosphate acyltransferase [Alphaproteobacteria bacterium]|nr:1-acyl-sn-glycerol-3-phosphate acyltransferase [Alphaproteobacteria bacterium]